MVYCPHCGKKADSEASYCSRCGGSLPSIDEDGRESFEAEFERRVEDFASEMESLGKKVGTEIERTFSDRYGRKVDPVGALSPLVWSVVGLLAIVLVMALMLALGGTYNLLQDIGELFLESLWWIFLVMLVLAYSSYLARNFPRDFRWLSPVAAAITAAVFLWFSGRIMILVDRNHDVPFIGTFGEWVINLLPIIFALILLIGLLGVLSSSVRRTPPREGRPESQGDEDLVQGAGYQETRRLYRSGRSKMIGGVCGGLGEYLQVDPTVIRVLWIILLLVSLGFGILAYIILWIVIPRNPAHRWD